MWRLSIVAAIVLWVLGEVPLWVVVLPIWFTGVIVLCFLVNVLPRSWRRRFSSTLLEFVLPLPFQIVAGLFFVALTLGGVSFIIFGILDVIGVVDWDWGTCYWPCEPDPWPWP